MILYNCEVAYKDGHICVYDLDMSKANSSFWQFIAEVWSDIDYIEIHYNYKELEK